MLRDRSRVRNCNLYMVPILLAGQKEASQLLKYLEPGVRKIPTSALEVFLDGSARVRFQNYASNLKAIWCSGECLV